MSKHAFPVIHLETEPSRALLKWLVAIHGLAILALLIQDGPVWISGLSLLAVMGSAGFCWRDYTRHSHLRMTLEPEGDIHLTDSSGTITGQIMASSVVTVWLVLLQVQTETGRRSILIARDATSPESFRLLRVSLGCMSATQHHADAADPSPPTDLQP